MARVLGISRGSAYELARRTDFPKLRVGRRIVIPRDAFLNWMNNQCYVG
ncbi:helix-turn-helix domain-containing protein [Collibacillus ludicampi]